MALRMRASRIFCCPTIALKGNALMRPAFVPEDYSGLHTLFGLLSASAASKVFLRVAKCVAAATTVRSYPQSMRPAGGHVRSYPRRD